MSIKELMDNIKGILQNILGVFPALLSRIIPAKKEKTAREPQEKRLPVSGRIKDILAGGAKHLHMPQVLQTLTDRTLHRFPENLRLPILFGLGGMTVLFLVLIISSLVIKSGKPKEKALQSSPIDFYIPSEDLFIPSEPDFLPEFIFGRERRYYWSIEDIRPYWKVPGNTDQWKEQIKTAVDKIMEGVP